MPPRVTVILPAHNEERNLPRTLGALARQTLPPGEFEVILLADRCQDRTAAFAASYAATLPLRVETTSFGLPGQVRNRGAELAKGPVLAFLDADCEPRPDFLAQGLALAPPATVWGADYLLPTDSTAVGRVWAEFQATAHSGLTGFVPGGTLWIAAADFQALGGFSPTLETSEDVDLCARARAAGLAVLAFPELACFHHGTPRTLAAFFRQNRWHGKHVLRGFLARPTLKTGLLLGLSLWMLLAALLAGCALLGALRHPAPLGLALLLLLTPPLLLAAARALPRRRLGAIPGLTLLYLIYLLARAAALLHRPARGVRA